MENHVRPDADTAVISITSPEDPLAAIKDGFHSVLRLQFDDDCEESVGERVGAIPDICPDGAVRCHNLVLPDAHHAKVIYDFIRQLHAERGEKTHHLIVHCHAGISRSAAVAQFVAKEFFAEIDQANPDTSGANLRLLRLLNKISSGAKLSCHHYVASNHTKERDRRDLEGATRLFF